MTDQAIAQETPPAQQLDAMRRDAQVVTTASSAPTPLAKSGEVLPPKKARRSFVLPLIVLAAVGYGGMKGYDWFTTGRFLVATDDAYVKADMSIIATKVAGLIASVPVVENGFVHQGDLLATLDSGDYQLAVDAAAGKIATQDATISRIGEQVLAQGATVDQAKAQLLASQGQVSAAKADQIRAQGELDRSSKLMQSSFGTQQRLDQAQADRDRAVAAFASSNANASAAQAAIDAAKASIGVLQAQKVEAQRMRGELQIALEKAQRDLSFTQIRAPFDGVIGNKAAQPGQYVQPGTRLLALVPLSSVYVEANFKETQLGSLKPGQKVTLNVDAVAGRKIEGMVESIAPASGAQFSLLPPENATGNFTKIVQRVAVRIAVPADVAKSGLLRPGLSVAVDVHTRDENEPKPSLMGALGLTRDGH